MAVGELVINHIVRVLLPLALLVLPVPHLHRVEVGLADVMEETADCDTLTRRRLRAEEIFVQVVTIPDQSLQPFIHMDAVLHQAARTGEVEAGGGRGLEEVRGLQPRQELVCSGPGDVLPVDFQKLFLHHKHSF